MRASRTAGEGRGENWSRTAGEGRGGEIVVVQLEREGGEIGVVQLESPFRERDGKTFVVVGCFQDCLHLRLYQLQLIRSKLLRNLLLRLLADLDVEQEPADLERELLLELLQVQRVLHENQAAELAPVILDLQDVLLRTQTDRRVLPRDGDVVQLDIALLDPSLEDTEKEEREIS